MALKVSIESGKAVSHITSFAKGLDKNLKGAVNEASKKLTAFVKKRYLSHHSQTSIGVVTDEIRKSTIPMHVRKNAKSIKGGVRIGTSAKAQKYVNVHVTKQPKTTVIKPKSGKKWLTIPLRIAQKANGSKAMTAREVPNSQFKKFSNDTAFIGSTNGKRGGFVPYFLLKKSVTIKSRVHTDKIIKNYTPVVSRIINKAIKDSIK